jgi:hypothetical protein
MNPRNKKMEDEIKIMWILAYIAKAARGEITQDCSAFADKSVEAYIKWLDEE